MCGIVGYVGRREAVPVLMESLARLEYRGYDSAGIAWKNGDKFKLLKKKGKISNLSKLLLTVDDISTHIGIAHTRWATHGVPSDENAHPHFDCTGTIALVHNGIIENYSDLRNRLLAEGHHFRSQTDTEVIAHLIESYYKGDILQAIQRALKEVKGSYALGILCQEMPDTLIAVRNQSPLILGPGDGEMESFMASDIPAILPFTRKAIYMNDGEMALLTQKGIELRGLSNLKKIVRKHENITWEPAMAEKGGFSHFMLKEIYEQETAIRETLRGRYDLDSAQIILDETGLDSDFVKRITRIIFPACGTSWHAGLIAKYWIEKWTGIPVEVDLASEFRYRNPVINENALTVSVSQSGETADTLAGLRIAKELGSKIVSICNVLGSTITREAHGTIYTHAGPEIGVASTKAFTSQLAALYLLGLYLAKQRGTLSLNELEEKLHALSSIPYIIATEMERFHDKASEFAGDLYKFDHFLYLGRHLQFPVALEGALKLKEISYIHAEAYAAGEMKHGPIALIDERMPVVALAPRDHVYEKVLSNIEEVRSRDGKILALGEKDDERLSSLVHYYIALPCLNDPDLNPFLYTIPLQLLAYEIALKRGCEIDQPRNLAKSVTVE